MKHIARILVGWFATLIILWILLTPTLYGSPYMGFGEALSFGFVAAVNLFFFSIICTAGFSLIFWLPLGSGVGWLVFKIFGWDKGKVTEEEPIMKFLFGVPAGKKKIAQQPQPPKPRLQALTDRLNQELRNDPALSRNQQALFNYVRKAKKKGLTNEQISLNLQNNGWPADSINWLLNYVG